jgi:predicted RNA-binding protein YlqC (UPF0109 family)
MSGLKELLEIIAKELVDKPDEVLVVETAAENGSVLHLNVAADDMGKVIGKQGRIAKSIRSLVKAAAIHKNVRVTVEIGDKNDRRSSG